MFPPNTTLVCGIRAGGIGLNELIEVAKELLHALSGAGLPVLLVIIAVLLAIIAVAALALGVICIKAIEKIVSLALKGKEKALPENKRRRTP